MLLLEDLTTAHFINAFPRLRGDAASWSFDETLRRSSTMSKYGESYALVTEDTHSTVLYGGFINSGTGIAHLWLVGTTDVPKHIKEITRILLDLRDPMMRRADCHRLQSEVLASKPSWIKWAKKFGLKEEGIMRKYTTDKQDCVLMAYILEDDE
jgi:hypothetical protein